MATDGLKPEADPDLFTLHLDTYVRITLMDVNARDKLQIAQEFFSI